MIAGCGSSNMLEDMAADGYQQLVGADISRVVIHQMKVRCADIPQVSFFQVNE
jgi:2-polyprenyl-3-methyl-5-hydroxy-6-metoxy-1,4-benzoquinol methylase